MYLLKIFLAILVIVGLAEAGETINHGNVDVHRSADGQLTAESLKNLEQLKTKALRQGYVTLWLTANVSYEPDTSKLSDNEAEKQDKEVRKHFDKVLKPLLRAGAVWFVAERPDVEGPGRLVQANADGVEMLGQDTRILHIHEET